MILHQPLAELRTGTYIQLIGEFHIKQTKKESRMYCDSLIFE